MVDLHERLPSGTWVVWGRRPVDGAMDPFCVSFQIAGHTSRYDWLEGNYSCDCNRAAALFGEVAFDCGGSIRIEAMRHCSGLEFVLDEEGSHLLPAALERSRK